MKQDSGTVSRRVPYGLFELKIGPYETYLKKIIHGIIRSPDRTEEIYSETVQKIYFATESWSGLNFKSWIARIAVNHAIDTKKKWRGEQDWLSLDELDEDRVPSPNSRLPEAEIIADETLSEVRRLIGELDELYRVPLEMYYRTNRSVKEIAAALELSPRTVETRIYRARQMIREKWRNTNAH